MSNIPTAYMWLKTLQPLPRMIAQALKEYGVLEAQGATDNPVILGWAEEIGANVLRLYHADDVPWCGLFMAVVAKRAGKQVPSQPLWALSWTRFGEATTTPSLGDVLVFRRNGGGHVALYVGEDEQAYHCLGGNQSDSVCITRVAKARLYAARRPDYQVTPATASPYRLASTGGLSHNEA